MNFLAPLVFLPNVRAEKKEATKGYLWGKHTESSRILKKLPKTPEGEALAQKLQQEDCIVSERWICSDDPDNGSLVVTENGAIPFRDLIEAYPLDILGAEHVSQHGSYLRTVMKQLDTNEEPTVGGLSVQVHPKTGHPSRPSKPEMWLGEGEVYLGWKEDMTEQKIRDAYNQGNLEEFLYPRTLQADQPILVAGGVIHAIRANSSLYEWSSALGEDDREKGSFTEATVALWDRTDGKQPRPGKEDLEGALEVLTHGDGLKALTDPVSDITTFIEADTAGNHLDRVFTTPEVRVNRYHIVTKHYIPVDHRGIPLFVEKGTVEIHANDTVTPLVEGQECFLPFGINYVEIRNVGPEPASLFAWYRPLSPVTVKVD